MPAPTYEGPGTFWQRLLHGVRRLYARSDWTEFLGADWPDHIMHVGVTDDHHEKQGRSTGRCVFEAGGKQLLPVHNGTFDLAMHAWQDPFERIVAQAGRQGVPVSTPQMGEPLNLNAPQAGRRWWREQSGAVPQK